MMIGMTPKSVPQINNGLKRVNIIQACPVDNCRVCKK